MSDCGCHHEAKNAIERPVLWVALALTAAMAVIGGVAGWIALIQVGQGGTRISFINARRRQ